MNNFLNDLALAHQRHEGYYVGSVAYRNNNPGNIRGAGGAFIRFSSYAAGFNALKGDLYAKIFGTAGTIQRFIKGTGRSYEQLVFQDYVSIYAPTEDFNDPVNYCTKLCGILAVYNVHPQTPLYILRDMILGKYDRVPDPPSPPLTLEQRLASAQNALKFRPSLERASMLRRLIARIQKLLGNS